MLTAGAVQGLREEYTRSAEPARALTAETLKLERVLNAECGMRNAEFRVVLPGLRPDPGKNCGKQLPADALRQVWQDGAAMNESEKQFSFTRAAPSTCGQPKSKFS